MHAGSPGAVSSTFLSPGLPPPHYGHSQPPSRPTSAQFPMMGIIILQCAFMCLVCIVYTVVLTVTELECVYVIVMIFTSCMHAYVIVM